MKVSHMQALSASDGSRLIREGALAAEQWTQACLTRVSEVDGRIHAWAYLDADYALAQARARDAERARGDSIGRLHGVPVGIQDVFDTTDLPTEDGTVLHAGRAPLRDASVVTMLRAAGAVVMGKTMTTELAAADIGKTCNPHNVAHSSGGSSGGSAAAVAATMVPLAVGIQTDGSVISSAAYCGVYGFKPTFGLIPRTGTLCLSRTLDQVGLFARTLEDVALTAEELIGYDVSDADTRPRARIPFLATALQEPPLPPTLAYLNSPIEQPVSQESKAAFAELVCALGDRVFHLALPDSARYALDWYRTIGEAEMAAALDREWTEGRDRLSAAVLERLRRGRDTAALDYLRARARPPLLTRALDEIFDRCDAILVPAAPSTAPRIGEPTAGTASSVIGTLCGMPALALPLMEGENGLPLGVQLIGRANDDARLLRTARWLQRVLQAF